MKADSDAVDPEAKPRRHEIGVSLGVFLWPFLYLSPYLVAIPGVGRQSGNDFDVIYYRYKTYLLDVLASEGRLPFWSPSEAAGYPFFASPFTASVYPLNLPLAWLYRELGGWSHQDHEVYSILAVAIFTLGLYRWLRATRLSSRAAAIAAIALGTSMKVTELLRMTNALHAAAWIPWMLLGMTRSAERGRLVRGIAITCLATVFFLTAGYPYFVYYFQFLAGPYLLMLLSAPARRALYAAPPPAASGTLRTLLGQGAGFGAAFLLCSPYLLRVAELIPQVHARSGSDYAFSTTATWDLPYSVGALVFPPAASAEGWIYFGLVHLFVIALFASGVIRRRDSSPEDRRLAIIAIAFFGFVSCIALGRGSPLFWVLWKTWPGFSSLRHWPRIHVLLVPVLALLLGRAYSALEERLADPVHQTRLGIRRLVLATTGVFVVVLALQLGFLWTGYVSYQWPLYFARYFDHLPGIDAHWYPAMAFAAWAMLVSGFVASHRRRDLLARRPWLPVAAVLLLGAADTGLLGILQWSEPKKNSDFIRQRPRVVERMPLALTRPRTARYTTVPLTPEFNVSGIEDWYYERYIAFLARQGLDKAALKQPERWHARRDLAELLGLVDGRRLFLSSAIDHGDVASFLADARTFAERGSARIGVVGYDGDRLTLDVETPRAGYLSFIDNWDPHWRAEVDGRPVEIERLFDTFKAIPLDPGARRVEFRYEPL